MRRSKNSSNAATPFIALHMYYIIIIQQDRQYVNTSVGLFARYGEDMSRYVIVTGSAQGIGRATVQLLRAQGAYVIGVDLKDADICCDLSQPESRHKLIADIKSQTPRIDAVVAAAGTLDGAPSKILSINFFGATQLLDGLRPLLAKSSAARAVVFSSTAARYPTDAAVIEACLNNDETAATRLSDISSSSAYATSKAALARWVRRHAVTSEWGGAGILLNAIAPGTIVNTGMTTPLLNAPGGAERLQKLVPSVIGRFGNPEDIAQLAAFLCNASNGYITGQVIYADGGTDALQRGDGAW